MREEDLKGHIMSLKSILGHQTPKVNLFYNGYDESQFLPLTSKGEMWQLSRNYAFSAR